METKVKKTKTPNKKAKIMAATLFGIGYVCGKHNLNVSKKEREKVALGFYNELVKQHGNI